MSMETLPMPQDGFCIHAPSQVRALLKQLQNGNVLLHLSTPEGTTCPAALRALDAERGVICFSADASDPLLQRLLACDEVVAVGYLDNIKVQFDVHGLVLVHSAGAAAMNGVFPRELYRFQRRASYRVRPRVSTTPTATMPNPAFPGAQLELRVVDVSLTGVALLWPKDAPPIEPGVMLTPVTLQLDAETRLSVELQLRHVTALKPEGMGARLGCEMVGLGGGEARALQRYIDHTQRHRRRIALD